MPRLAPRMPEDPKQYKLMVGALCLLLLALALVFWYDRDFWFSGTPSAESNEARQTRPIAKPAPAHESALAPRSSSTASTKTKRRLEIGAKPSVENPSAANPPVQESSGPAATITTRTVLPPLEVEVVAGDTRRTVRPGTGSVRVDIQPATPEPSAVDSTDELSRDAASKDKDNATAASITNDAADRVEMSADTSAVVTRSVSPSYPVLARQMKVQGSVILQALIGRDGAIENLDVVSGPHILAAAAEDAVRQWHFKPHLENGEAVETQAKITVNFTISTN
jgi:TonB family protein